MTCDDISPELIGFHFGTLGPGVRERVEAHLLDCASCLRTFLAIKHDLECPDDAPLPSAAARERLRRAVMQELGEPTARRWRWWEPPFALGVAATAALVALLAVHSVATGPGKPPRGLTGTSASGSHQ